MDRTKRKCYEGLPSSPDLTPLDFHLWRTSKNMVYATEHKHWRNREIRWYVALFDVVVGSALWQKVDILNMYGLKEV